MDLLDAEDARILANEGDLIVVDEDRLLIRMRHFHTLGLGVNECTHSRSVSVLSSGSPSPTYIDDNEGTIEVPKTLSISSSYRVLWF